MLRFMENKEVIGDSQHGFTKGKFCLPNAVVFYEGVPASVVLGLVPCNIFVGAMDSGIECSLNQFANNTKLCGTVNTERDAILKDLDRLERLQLDQETNELPQEDMLKLIGASAAEERLFPSSNTKSYLTKLTGTKVISVTLIGGKNEEEKSFKEKLYLIKVFRMKIARKRLDDDDDDDDDDD
ncbi:hypothetical protein TURU_138719 [Turdus rufiventris]|nr:hypothetical protein TURU_138719 [Turdus rufiventris]